ncbi:MAG: hypothetical protein PWP65_1445 [Clostridia bacterium]|nr:hypothetical protein [Clostridia bacterium]
MAGAERGLVLEVKGRRVTVLTPGGDFCSFEIAGKPPKIGEEVMLTAGISFWRRWVRVAAIAAVFLLLVLGGQALMPVFWPFAWGNPAYYVSVDINPSLELTVSDRERVLEAKPLNGDGEKVLEGLSLKGKKAGEAIKLLTRSASKRGYLARGSEGAVVLTVVPAQEGDREALLAGSRLAAALAEEVRRTLGPASKAVLVEATALQPVIREHALKAGLSTGKYGVLIEALDAGMEISPQELRDKSIVKILGDGWKRVVGNLSEGQALVAKEVRLRPNIEQALRCSMMPEEDDKGGPRGQGQGRGPGKEQGKGKGPEDSPAERPGSDSRGALEKPAKGIGGGPPKAEPGTPKPLPDAKQDSPESESAPVTQGRGRELLDKLPPEKQPGRELRTGIEKALEKVKDKKDEKDNERKKDQDN